MNIIVIISAIIIVFSAFSGYHKGLLRTAITMCSFILAMAIAAAVNPVVTSYVEEHFSVEEMIYDVIGDALEQKLGEKTGDGFPDGLAGSQGLPEGFRDRLERYLQSADSEELPEELRSSLEYLESFLGDGLGLPEPWRKGLDKLAEEGFDSQLGVEGVFDNLVSYYTNMATKVISYSISLIIAAIVIRVLVLVTGFVTKLPVLSGLNRLAGLLLGLLRGVIILWILGLVVTVCSGFEWAAPVLGMIKESAWLTFLYKNNLLALLLVPAAGALL